MFDSVKIQFEGNRLLPSNAEIVADGTRGGAPFLQAKLGNLMLSHTLHGLTVQGSLTRYLRGENVGAMTLGMVRESLNKLEEALGFPIAGGLVRSLEVGRTLTMKHLSGDMRN